MSKTTEKKGLNLPELKQKSGSNQWALVAQKRWQQVLEAGSQIGAYAYDGLLWSGRALWIISTATLILYLPLWRAVTVDNEIIAQHIAELQQRKSSSSHELQLSGPKNDMSAFDVLVGPGGR
eukprot:TRINITY_DN4292_c0_g1_i3.p1 TRINITY_DN4292_c0_g1~~TRINITY_DN4292_c0_g1_i3.p1  ORF type:complete len:122 (+),score=20.59 TRINITY_DN4292_c0_g1_i3:107-472(+)